MHYRCVLTQPSLGGMRNPPETNPWRAGWQRKILIMAAFSFFRLGGMPDEQGKKSHKLILTEVDAGCGLQSRFFVLRRDARAGCSSRQFGGEAEN